MKGIKQSGVARVPSLKQWFPEGVDTPGIVLVPVEAKRIRYWQQEDEGELLVK